MRQQIHVPFQPLWLRAVKDSNQGEWHPWAPHKGFNYKNLADAIGVTHRTVLRWAKDGRLLHDQADRAACALGYHPVDIWPDWFELMMYLVERDEAKYQRRLERNARYKQRQRVIA